MLFKKYRRQTNPYNQFKYKQYRNKLNILLRKAKKKYNQDYFNQNATNLKKIWSGIKDIVNFNKKGSRGIPTHLKEGDREITDAREMANQFNKHFSSIGKTIGDSISLVNRCPLNYIDSEYAQSFFLTPVTKEEIQIEIQKLNSRKSTGPYRIPAKILKLINTSLSEPLEVLYNFSFSSGTVPRQFKVANIIPILKKGCPTSINNYRPIALLSIFNKILEKLMYKRMVYYVQDKNILFKNQFGFRSGHSTSQAILLITDKIQKAIENKKYSCGIFLDLTKAFDTVNHEILLKKLNCYGIRGLVNNWFESYLHHRKQYVSIGNIQSDEEAVSCGVPQGSVLGPLLFLLYINDFQNCSSLLEFHLFADDANIFYSHENLFLLEQYINVELCNVYEWLCANKLSLNIDKTNVVIFRCRQKRINHMPKFFINNLPLKQEESIRYLGIYIDSHLNWKTHIHYISKKINRSIGMLFKLRHYLTLKQLIQLYYSLIYPFLTYGLITWGNTYTSSLQPLISLQKKVMRVITFSRFDAPSEPLFKKHRLLKLTDLVYFQNSLFMFDYHSNILPSTFGNYFVLINMRHNYSTRLASTSSYCLPIVRTNYGKFSLRFQGQKIWNDLDERIKSASRTIFKNEIINSILNCYKI